MNGVETLIIITQFLLKDIAYEKLVKQKEEKLLEKYAEIFHRLNESLKEAINCNEKTKK